jgi:type II secretory pathway component PulF
MFTISHVTQKIWPLVLLSMFGTLAGLVFVEKFRNAVLFMAMSKWRILRQLIMGMRQMLFLGSLNMLHANGINLARAVQIAAEGLKGTPMYRELIEAGKRYQMSGLPFSEAVRKFTSCDPQVGHMISIGERSSSLDDQLRLLTNMYEEEVDQTVNDFTQIVNIVALLLACVLISMVFIGAFLPIFLMGPKMMYGQGI